MRGALRRSHTLARSVRHHSHGRRRRHHDSPLHQRRSPSSRIRHQPLSRSGQRRRKHTHIHGSIRRPPLHPLHRSGAHSPRRRRHRQVLAPCGSRRDSRGCHRRPLHRRQTIPFLRRVHIGQSHHRRIHTVGGRQNHPHRHRSALPRAQRSRVLLGRTRLLPQIHRRIPRCQAHALSGHDRTSPGLYGTPRSRPDAQDQGRFGHERHICSRKPRKAQAHHGRPQRARHAQHQIRHHRPRAAAHHQPQRPGQRMAHKLHSLRRHPR